MKVDEAPERIILSADRDTKTIYDEWVTKDLTDNIKIEYIRTDAFIEKAVSYVLSHKPDMHILGDSCVMDELIVKDFVNYMKGE
jgi:hypothetical protein